MKIRLSFCVLPTIVSCLISAVSSPCWGDEPAGAEPEYKRQGASQWVRYMVFEVISKDGVNSEILSPESAEVPADLETYQAYLKKYRDQAPAAIKVLGMSALPSILQLLKTPGSGTDRKQLKFPDVGDQRSICVETSPRVYRGQALQALRQLLPASVPAGKMIIYELERILATPGLDPDVEETVRYCLRVVIAAQSQ